MHKLVVENILRRDCGHEDRCEEAEDEKVAAAQFAMDQAAAASATAEIPKVAWIIGVEAGADSNATAEQHAAGETQAGRTANEEVEAAKVAQFPFPIPWLKSFRYSALALCVCNCYWRN